MESSRNASKLFELLLKLLLAFEFSFLECKVTRSLDHIGLIDFMGYTHVDYNFVADLCRE